jgi:hypothetical protein
VLARDGFEGSFEKLKTATIDYQTVSIDMNAPETVLKSVGIEKPIEAALDHLQPSL